MLFGDQEDLVRVQGAGHTERARLSTEQGVAFLEAMDALAPDSIPNGWEGGIDGCFFTCSVQNERGAEHRFLAWSPHPDSSPQQYAFISRVHQLAWDAAQKAATISLLEKLWGYFNDGLPARVFQEDPPRVRIFGRVISTNSKQLEALFASVPPQAPVLVDMTNFEGMGTLLHPLFAHFHERPGLTAWLVNASASQYLRGAGIPSRFLHQEPESALAALKP